MRVRNIHAASEWFEVLQTSKNSQTAVMILNPGQSSGDSAEAHRHSEQTLLVVTGHVEGEVENETLSLQPGDVITVSEGMRHRFWNKGTQAAVTFNVYAPPEYRDGAKG